MYVYSSPATLKLDIQSVSSEWLAILDFSQNARLRSSESEAIANCFSFAGDKSDSPSFSIQNMTETQLTLKGSGISSKDDEIAVTISDCYDFMSVEKAARMQA